MLADPRTKSLVTNFAGQWFTVDEIDAIKPDPSLFPEFDNQLRRAFRRGDRAVSSSSVFSEDQSVVNLLTANYTFVNERLALHYGIPNVRGDRFRRVQLTEPYRYGILGKGAFLMGMSYAQPHFTGASGRVDSRADHRHAAAAPPPGVEALKENMDGQRAQTVRERMVRAP